MLSARQVADILMQRGLLSAAAVVDGDLRIYDASRRNHNFRVLTRSGRSYIVKQGIGAGGRAMIANEAEMYGVLAEAGQPIARYVPTLHAYDPGRSVLVIELVESSRSLDTHQSRGRFSVRVAGFLGRSLAALHAIGPQARLTDVQPFALSLHRPALAWLRDLSEANVELIKLLQGTRGLVQALDDLRAGWRSQCAIHGDVKAENCLVVMGSNGRGTATRLIDWESGGIGDPAWDTGSVLGGYLWSWLDSIPLTDREPPARWPELARFPLQRMRPAMSRFWSAYSRAAGLDAASSDRGLIRAAHYAGVRLLQTAFERTQAVAGLDGTTRCIAQLAVNVLRSPHEAAVHLLGVPLQGVARR